MTAVSKRDLDKTRKALDFWLRCVRGPASRPRASDVVIPSAGLSGDQIMFTAAWSDGGVRHEQDLVLRLEPTEEFQLFPDTNFAGQYRMLKALNEMPDVPVPKVTHFSEDSSLLGARFYVMEKLPGRAAAPQQAGWVQRLSGDEREEIWWGGLRAMASVHRVDARDLELGGDAWGAGRQPGAVLGRQLEYYRSFYESACEGVRHPATEDAFDWLRENKPRDPLVTVQWGDARLGNLLFDEARRCCGVIDWEQAEVGFAEADLGWWLLVDSPDSCLAQPVVRPRVRISSAETIAGYEKLLGRPLTDMTYWEIFAAVRTSPIILKLQTLARKHGFRYPREGNDAEDALAKLLERV